MSCWRTSEDSIPTISGFEDWELWLHALANGWHGVQVAEVTVLYRRHAATNFTNARADYRRWYRVIRSKHRELYRRRRELARESELGPLGAPRTGCIGARGPSRRRWNSGSIS